MLVPEGSYVPMQYLFGVVYQNPQKTSPEKNYIRAFRYINPKA